VRDASIMLVADPDRERRSPGRGRGGEPAIAADPARLDAMLADA